MRAVDGNGIDEVEFKSFDMDLIIPSLYSSTMEHIEKFFNIDVNTFLQSSRDFVIQGEMLKLFLVLQPNKNSTSSSKSINKGKDDQMHSAIGYHVDVRLRNPEDFVKSSATPSSSKVVSKSIMISNPKHGHVRHTPKLNSEYDTETANQLMDADTAYSSGSEATATSTSSTITATTVTTIINSPTMTSTGTKDKDGASVASADEFPKGPLADFVVINSPAGTVKAKNGLKPNFFRLPDGTIIFPIEIPVGVKTKYNNKDISVVVSVARVMQPPAAGNKVQADIFPVIGSAPQHHVTSATKLEKLLSAQYPQYWQYSQYSRGGIGSILPPITEPKASIHGSHSNPNLVGLGSSSSLTRTTSVSNNPTALASTVPNTSSSTLLPPNTLSNTNSRSDPNISGMSSSEDTLSPLPSSNSNSSSNLLTPNSTMPSRGSSGNLYGMGQLQTSTSSATLTLASMATATGGQTSSTVSTNLNTNLGVTSGAPVAIKTAQKIVRVLEPLQVRLLQHYTPSTLKIGTKRLIPVAVSNVHPTLPITVRGLQLVLSNIPSLEGGNNAAPGPGPDVPYSQVSVTDKYKTSTLDIEIFPVVVAPGDEYNFVVSVEPHTPTSTITDPHLPPPPPPTTTRVMGISTKRRVIYKLEAQLAITWSIPCSPGSILSIHPLPVVFPAQHDLLVSFDSKSPVRVNNIFNVCFTITNLSDYSRDLTFIIPRPVCVTGYPTSTSLSSSSSRSFPRSPPPRAATLASIRYTPSPSTPGPSFASPLPPPRTPSAQNLSNSSPSLGSPSIPSSPRAVLPNDTSVDEEELLVRFGELQASSASMLCLEKTLYVGLVKSNSSVSVNVRYIPMREGLFEIQGLQIFDRANDQMYVVQDTCQLYVIA